MKKKILTLLICFFPLSLIFAQDNFSEKQITTIPHADFVAEYTTLIVGDSANFIDLSQNNPSTWYWTFQGGTPYNSTLQHPTNIKYDFAGNYNVKLIISNIDGIDSIIKNMYIHVITNSGTLLPITSFNSSNRLIVSGQNVNFVDQSQNYPLQWHWYFPGGFPSTSNLQNPTNIFYNNPGFFPVTLVTFNPNGSDSLIKTDYILVTNYPISIYCDTMSNIGFSESIYYKKLTNTWGYLPGPNGSNIKAYAEKFINYTFSEIKSIIVPVQKSFASSSSSKVRFTIWSGNNNPQAELGFIDIPLNLMPSNYYKLVTFDPPIQVDNTFFVGYELTYSIPQDTFVSSIAVDRGVNGLNTLYVKNATNSWLTCSDFFGVHTSLAINVNGCLENYYPVNIVSKQIEDKIIIYPIPSSTIINIEFFKTTVSSDIDIKIYDLLGKEISVPKFKISEINYQIDFSSQETGIYVINLKNSNGLYSKKISIIK